MAYRILFLVVKHYVPADRKLLKDLLVRVYLSLFSKNTSFVAKCLFVCKFFHLSFRRKKLLYYFMLALLDVSTILVFKRQTKFLSMNTTIINYSIYTI